MFRKEVAEAKRQHLLGKVTLVQPVSTYISTSIVVMLFIIVFVYISVASYSRKETVKGYLTPEKGLVKVFSDRIGVVDVLYVKEGDRVKQGDSLLKIRRSQSLSTGVELSEELTHELLSQIKTLKQEYNAASVLSDDNVRRLKSQINQLRSSCVNVRDAIMINKRKIKLKEIKINKNRVLLDKKYVSGNQFDAVQEELLEVLSEGNQLSRELTKINSEMLSLESELNSEPEQLSVKQAIIMRKISELKSQVTELSGQYEFIKKAPEAGVVTAIQPTAGSQVDSNAPLLSIIPFDSPLEIELLLPTRSAGFVQLGDKVKIRFDAFPYQKFGFISGEVINVDKALILPSDNILPVIINEAMYRVRAKLHQQSVHAYGKQFPLKVGMLADADVILEQRSLLEWLLDPIYAVKGRLE